MVKKSEEESTVAAAAPRAEKARKTSGPGGLFRFGLLTALAVTVMILLGAAAIHRQVLLPATSWQGNQLARIHAEEFAEYFNRFFRDTNREVARITANPELASTLQAGDREAISRLTTSLASSLPTGSRLFLVSQPSSIPEIPLGYAAQEMAERARRGETVNPEIIPLKEISLLLTAASIRDAGGNLVGAMLIGFDLAGITKGLDHFDAGNGFMSLTQTLDGDPPMPVITHGDATMAESEYVSRLPTMQENLAVQFSLRSDALKTSTDALFLLLVIAMIALTLTAIFVTGFFLTRAVRRNTSMLLLFSESLLTRRPIPAGIAFTIDVFDDAAMSLLRTSNSQPAAEGARMPVSRSSSRDALEEVSETTDFEHGQEYPVPQAVEAAPAAPKPSRPPTPATAGGGGGHQVPDEIFRAYDIRGVVGRTLTEDIVRLIGKAIGSEAIDCRQSAIHVGRDGRLSGPQLLAALVEGITSTGCNVIDLGMVPTPVVYFAAANSALKSGVMLTGSHNPPDYNGLKIVIAGETLSDERIQALKQRIQRGDFRQGSGKIESQDIVGKYIDRIREDIVLARPLKIVIDCGNGVAGAIAPQLFAAIGCQVIPLFCEVDGNFPNHHPDPSKDENLRDLIARVLDEKADLGLAFDGDGDRVGVVTPQGKVIWPDRLMMLYARDILMRNPGADIIFDVKCTRDLAQVISQHGGRPIMWRTGHSLIKAKLKETGAALAGEMSGHIFFNDRWPGFDDGLYSGTRLLEILSLEVGGADEVFAEFPANIATPELQINVTEDAKFRIIDALQKSADFPGGSISTIDGLRVDFPNAWGLVRASNTTPVLVARFEGRTEEDLATVREAFRAQLLQVEPSLRINF